MSLLQSQKLPNSLTMYEEGGVGLPSSTIDDSLPHTKVMAGRKCESGRTFNILVCLFYLLPTTGMSSPSAEMRMISILRVFFLQMEQECIGR